MIISKTPLRLSLLGGNTDFPKYFGKHGGAVFTTTIDKYIYCIVKKRFDNNIFVNYSEKEVVDHRDKIRHDIVRTCLQYLGISEGIEITFLSDIPSEGSGLGSSSAVTVGLLNALHSYKGETIDAGLLAEEACAIEINLLNKPIGWQDQYAVSYGGTNLIKFNSTEVIVEKYSDFDASNLLLLWTGITRSADRILFEMKLNKRILDKNKTLAILGATLRNDYEGFGILMDNYWNLKRKLNSKVTDDKFDRMYEDAKEMGAIGGKIVGAGGGGFFLFVVPSEKRDVVKRALRLKELPFNIDKYGSRIIFNDE